MLIFSNFGVRHVASQRFFDEKQHVCVFLDHVAIFPDCFALEKARNTIWRKLLQTRARELRFLTIWHNFV